MEKNNCELEELNDEAVHTIQEEAVVNGQKKYNYNIYDDKSEIIRKCREEYRKLYSAEDDIENACNAVDEMFKLIERVNNNILIHGLIERKDLIKYRPKIQKTKWDKFRIIYVRPSEYENDIHNSFDDADLGKGFIYAFNGVFNLRLINGVQYHYFDEIRTKFRNIRAHQTRTMFANEFLSEDEDNYGKIRNIFDTLIQYLVIIGVIDDEDLENVENTLVSEGDSLQHGKYIVKKLLSGEGGSSRVYLCSQTGLRNRDVAIKEYRSDTNSIKNISDPLYDLEKQNLCNVDIKCKNIPKVIDAFSENGTKYIVMEYIDGKDMRNYLNEEKPPFRDLVLLLTQIADTFDEMHRCKVTHGDIKLENILVTKDKSIYVIDLGAYGINYSGKYLHEDETDAYKKDIILFGELINEILKIADFSEKERFFLQTIADGCMNGTEQYNSFAEVSKEFKKNTVFQSIYVKLRLFFKNPRKRRVFIIISSAVAALIVGIIIFMNSKFYYIVKTPDGQAKYMINKCEVDGKNLRIASVLVNRRVEYLDIGSRIRIEITFTNGEDDKKLRYSYTTNSVLEYNDAEKYEINLSRTMYKEDYYADIFSGNYDMIKDVKMEIINKGEQE